MPLYTTIVQEPGLNGVFTILEHDKLLEMFMSLTIQDNNTPNTPMIQMLLNEAYDEIMQRLVGSK